MVPNRVMEETEETSLSFLRRYFLVCARLLLSTYSTRQDDRAADAARSLARSLDEGERISSTRIFIRQCRIVKPKERKKTGPVLLYSMGKDGRDGSWS